MKRSSPSTPSTEGMALGSEQAHLMFQDSGGLDRPDAVMLDPGASAFLSGYGPFKRYVEHLASIGYPVERLQMVRCSRRFQFGGDAASYSHWTVMLPVFADGRYGTVQMYLLPGDTPMLCGRPIIEALGMTIDFSSRMIRFNGSSWIPATMGAHGEYLLSLAPPDMDWHYDVDNPDFELKVSEGVESSTVPVYLDHFNQEEHVFTSVDQNIEGSRPLRGQVLKTADVQLRAELNKMNAYVTKEIRTGLTQPRMLWEVYSGTARTSAVAESLGMVVETFSMETGWDFNLYPHQQLFLERLVEEEPHEVLVTPVCRLWSQMQNLACQTDDQKTALMECHQDHHDRHLLFVRKIYLSQVDGGRH